MSRPPFCMMVVVAAAPWFGLVAVSAADQEPPRKIREIYVPFEELPLLVDDQPGRVLLSREEYESLLKASRKTPEVRAPYAVTVVSADYAIVVGQDRAEFSGTITLDVLQPGLHAVELDADGVGVRRAVLDGRGAPIARRQPSGLMLFVEGLGRHKLTLDMTAPVETTAAQQRLTFKLPMPPVIHATMSVPGNVDIRSGAAVVSRVFDETAQLTRFEILPQPERGSLVADGARQVSRFEPASAPGTVSLVMTLNSRFLQARRAVSAKGVLVDEITAAYERLHATFSMTVMHQAVDRFRFAVPDGFEITDVKSPLLSNWAVTAEESRSVLDVRLREATGEKVVLGVSALKLGSDPARWALPRLEPLEVIGEAAVVGLLLEDRLTVRSLAANKLIPIDTRVITDALPGMIFGAESGGPRLRAVAAYYCPTGLTGSEVAGVFTEAFGRFLVTTNVLLTAGEKGLLAQGGFTLKPVTERLFAVDFSVPEGWHVPSLTDAEKNPLRFEIINAAEDGEPARVHLAFPGGIVPGAQRSIYFEATHTPAGWLSKWTTARVTFPVFAVLGAERDIGAIALQGGEGLAAYPDVAVGLTPLDDRDKIEYGLSAAGGVGEVSAFRYDRRPYQATFRVERIAPRMTAKVYSFFELDPDLLSATYEAVLDIDRAKTDTLFLSLPASTSADLSISGLSGTTVKGYESALMGERRRWTVHLAEPRRDTVRLAVKLELPLDCRQPLEFTLPMLRAEDVAHQSGVVSVEGSAGLDMQAVTTLRKVDVGELADATQAARRGGAGGLEVFAYVGDDPAISVRLAGRPGYDLPSAIVQRAELITQLSANGAAQTAARLEIRAAAAFLEIELPTASTLWSVEIDDKPMQPQREGDRLLLSLPATDRTLDLRVVYESSVERAGLWDDVALAPPRFFVRAEGAEGKRIEVPTADLQWSVALPVGFRLADYAGTVTTWQRVWPKLAAWRVARWLWLGTGGIRPFYGGCWPSLSRAREFSHAVRRQTKESFLEVEEFADPRPKGPAARTESRHARGAVEKTEALKPAAKEEAAADAAKKIVAGVAPSFGAATPSYWALEGVRSLKIDLERSGHVVEFSSLGVDPKLRLTLTNETRVAALGWGLAIAAALTGLVLTPRPARIKTLYVAAVAAVTTVAPIVLGSTELPHIANPIFYAVSLLVPFYVLVRLVPWIFANARRPIFLRAPKTASTAALGLVLALYTIDEPWTSAHADDRAGLSQRLEPPAVKGTQDDPLVVRIAEPLRPIEVPDDAIIVPYDPSALQSLSEPWASAHADDRAGLSLRLSGNQVLIPYATFQYLWKTAHPEAQLQAIAMPASYAFAGGAFTASLEDSEYLDLQGYLDIVVYADTYVTVPLVISDAVLARAQLDGRPAQLSAQPATPDRKAPDSSAVPFTLQLKDKGSHRLDLSVRLRLSREGGWRVAQGRIPTAPGTALTLHIPQAGTEVRLDGVCDRRGYETKAADETITAALGPEGLLNLRWRPRVREGLSDSSLTANSDALFDVREDGLRLVWKLTLDSGRGERDSHRLIVPPDYTILAIAGPNVRGWYPAEGDRQEVVVSLLQADKGAEQITVALHQRHNLTQAGPTKFDVPVIRVVGAALQNGRLTIRRSSALDLSTASTSGVTRTDTPGEPWASAHADDRAGLSLRLSDAPDSPLGMAAYQAYRFASLPFVIQLEVKPLESHLSADLQTILRIGDRRRTLETRMEISPGPRPVYQLRVGVPADLTDLQVEAPGAFEWAVTESTPRILTVFMTAGQQGRFPIIVRGTLGEDGPLEKMDLPRFELPDTESQRGKVAIQIDPAFDLHIDQMKYCAEIPLEDLYGWLTAPQRPLTRMALKHEGKQYEASLRITPRRPDVACTTVSNVRVTQSTIEETILLDFVVTQAGIREISFVLPEWMKDSRISIPMLRAKTFEPVTGDSAGVRVRLVLQDELMGRIRVLIENDRAVSADAFQAPLPIVETGRTDRRFVAMENASRDEVTVESQTGFEMLTHSQSEWRTLTDLLGATLTQAYVATGESPALMLKTSERMAVETTGARIGLARTVLVADAAGAYRATQSYRVDNRSEQFLEVLLPGGAGLWSVQVAGKPVKPAGTILDARPTLRVGEQSSRGQAEPRVQDADRRVRIPLIKSAAGDMDYEVVLKYAGTLPPSGALRTADFPLPRVTNIAAELSQVSLVLPKDYLWFDFGGTMRQVDDEAELLAGFVRYQTRLTERLGQTLESDSPFARARAFANIKEAESQIEVLRGAALSRAGNKALDAELKSSEQVVARAQVQQQRQQTQQQEMAQEDRSLDNRQKLTSTFEKQQAARARNQVQGAESNFAVLPQGPPPGQEGAGPAFDRKWLESKKIGDQVTAGQEGQQQVQARVQTDDTMMMRQRQAALAAPQAPQFVQQPGAGERGKVGAKQAPAKGRRAAGTEELALQYQQQLEQTGPESKAAPAPVAGEARGYLGVDRGVLAEWAGDLPLRGAVFHFTTPRGAISVTARSISRSVLASCGRFGIVVLALLAFALLYRLATRLGMAHVISRAGATGLIVLGILSALTGVFPVVGVLAVIGGLVARSKLRETRPVTAG